MKNLPRNSVIHLEREAEFDKVVMSYPSRTSARTGVSIILFIIGLVAANFWYEAFVDLFGNRFELMDLMQLLFTTAIIGFAGFMGKFALRRPVPESLLVVGESIIHDSGTDPFRKTAVDKSEARQNELFFKPRKRMHFSPEEVATLSKTDIPYENRIYLEADGKRHDLGEGLSSAERAWLYDFLLTKLAHPETVSRQAADLIKRVEAEERIKPKITDVHSKHRVDPLDFDDPVAQRANWKTITDASANFRTHKLAPGRRQLAFKPTRSAQIFGLLFPGVGLIALMLSALELFSKEVTFAFVFLLIFGCLFLASGVYLVRKIFVPIVFDLRRNHFRKGWSDAQPVPLDEVYGLQLLSFMPTGEGVHTGYELNLLLKDGSRRGVVCHGDRESLREHTDTLSQFLGKPVFDGIVPKRQQPHTMRRPIKAEDRSLIWLAVVCLIIVVSTIAVWQLDQENPGGAGTNESIVADESTNQPTSVGRPVLFSELVQEARELDGNGKTHLANFYYHEILKQFHNGPTSEPEKTRLLAEVADFFFRKSTLIPDQIDNFCSARSPTTR
ncbi:MAG: hypothetical protein O7G86_19780 [Gammaproteobacteria bacterium]|nr:hypothetical protein [Gammaproteobacteria bacterium]